MLHGFGPGFMYPRVCCCLSGCPRLFSFVEGGTASVKGLRVGSFIGVRGSRVYEGRC